MADDGEKSPERRSLRAVQLAGVVTLGLTAALGGAWVYRLPLGEMLIRASLGGAGHDAQLHLQSLDFGGATVRAVRIGNAAAPDFWADRARVDLDWSAVLPRVAAVSVTGGGLRVAVSDKGVSLGALDRLGVSKVATSSPQLPDWAITIANFHVIGETPFGRIDAPLRASGRLHTNFRAHAEIAPHAALQLSDPGTREGSRRGPAPALTAQFDAATVNGRINAAFDASAPALVWRTSATDPGLEISGARVSAQWIVPVDLKSVSLGFDLGAAQIAAPGGFVVHDAHALAQASLGAFGPGFSPGPMSGSYKVEVAAAEAHGATLAAGQIAGPFAAAFADKRSEWKAPVIVTLRGANLGADARRSLGKAIPALAGTPLQPLAAGAKAALDRALERFDLDARLDLAWSGRAGELMTTGPIRATARTGAIIIAASPPGVAPLTIALPGGAMHGALTLQTKGGGLPDATLAVSRASTGADAVTAEGDLAVRDWRASGAGLSIDDAHFVLTSARAAPGGASPASGALNVTGRAIVSGPFAGFQIVDAQTPLDLRATWGDGLRVQSAASACVTVVAAQIKASGVTFANPRVVVCPVGAAFVAIARDGVLSGGFTLEPIAWRGHMDGADAASLGVGQIAGRLSGRGDAIVLDIKAAAPAFDAAFAGKRTFHARADAVTARLLSGSAGWSLAGALVKGEVRDTSLPVRLEGFDAVWRGAPRGDGAAVFTMQDGRGQIGDPSSAPLLHPITASQVGASFEGES